MYVFRPVGEDMMFITRSPMEIREASCVSSYNPWVTSATNEILPNILIYYLRITVSIALSI